MSAPAHVLVVEDEPKLAALLRDYLAAAGFRVSVLARGDGAVDWVRSGAPDAILLDVSMDDLDGWQAARMVRESGFTDLPIVMVSADLFENRPENLANAQAQAFVAKPVIESELLDALGRHLEIEWITDLTVEPPEAPPATLDVGAFGVPVEALAELRRLALAGRPRGLRERLDALAREHPDLAPLCAQWSRLVDAFDFDTLQQRLRASDDS